MTLVDFKDDRSEILFNPRMTENEQQYVSRILHKVNLKRHIWVATSGSTALKWVALSKEAVLTSANAVNLHLRSSSEDIWINPLPDFHVGGLGIYARSYIIGAKMIAANKEKWNAHAFHKLADSHQATLTALVPTQIHDLVSASLHAPLSMRAVIIGGGSLSEALYQKAIELGWPLLPSYGLTECASQVATASLESMSSKTFPSLKVLSHVETSVNKDGFVKLKSSSLLTGYVLQTTDGYKFVDPKQDGWFATEDLGDFNQGHLKIFGRQGNFVKIGGESVDIDRLQHLFEALKLNAGVTTDAVLIAVPEERLGHVVHLAVAGVIADLQPLIDQFQNCVLPFERIRKTHALPFLPRTSINKLCKADLLKSICKSSLE